jgi:hypothetical protein
LARGPCSLHPDPLRFPDHDPWIRGLVDEDCFDSWWRTASSRSTCP